LNDLVPTWLARLGVRSWLYVGIVLWAAIVYSALATVSGLVMPLVVAAVIGALFSPLVTALAARGVPRRVAGVLVMLGLLAVFVGAFRITIDGVIDQAPEIGRQLSAGLDAVGSWLEDTGVVIDAGDELVAAGSDVGSWLVRGLASSLSSVFSSALALLAGVLVGLFFLYYLLAEWDQLLDWLAGHLGVGADVGRDILDDSTSAVRQYFFGLTVSSVIVAVIVGATMVVLGLPLALTIAIVTLVTSYVPYLGAIFSGAFAFLIALGSGGPSQAVIVLVVVLVAQNLVQTVVQTKLTSEQLQIHPMVNFASTIVGASLAGLLGATLSAPIVAIVLRTARRLRAHGSEP
jgi:predicted PurR-regulated permease PerM